MSHMIRHSAAALAAILIMIGTFSPLLMVPQAQASVIAAPVLA